MKRLLLFFILLAGFCLQISASTLQELLIKLPNVKSVELLDSGVFSERYQILFEQPVCHADSSKGFFCQRVVVAHAGFDRPTLLVTEGYGGERSLRPAYREEISSTLNTNQIFVEHRYFGVSVPKPCDWSEMTGKNAAADLHAIKQVLSSIYDKKWIASGISKGGQNTMIYATYFPGDVDAYVPYVGPVCSKVEDGRHEPFLRSVGRKSERDSILVFQKELLSRRNTLVPMLEEFCQKNNMEFNVGFDEIFDLCVLEFSFTLWQWGDPVSSLPDVKSDDKSLFTYLVNKVSPDYFMVDRNSPFFVQAASELGYYGYDVRPFKKLLSIRSARGYLDRVMLPEDARCLQFSPQLSDDINSYLKNNDPRMLFIYGEIDPWSSVMPDPRYANGKQNMHFYIQPRGSHRTRINTQPDSVKQEIWARLRTWLDL